MRLGFTLQSDDDVFGYAIVDDGNKDDEPLASGGVQDIRLHEKSKDELQLKLYIAQTGVSLLLDINKEAAALLAAAIRSFTEA